MLEDIEVSESSLSTSETSKNLQKEKMTKKLLQRFFDSEFEELK